MPTAFVLALDSAGKSIPARMAMIAITTRSSMRVKPAFLAGLAGFELFASKIPRVMRAMVTRGFKTSNIAFCRKVQVFLRNFALHSPAAIDKKDLSGHVA